MHFHVWVGQYISITEGKMILAALAQFAVCFLIMAWVLKKRSENLIPVKQSSSSYYSVHWE